MFRLQCVAGVSEPAVGPNVLPIKLVSSCLSSVTKCLVCEADHRFSSSAEENEWGCNSAVPYVFLTRAVTIWLIILNCWIMYFFIFYYFALWPTNAQLFHKLSHSYMFRHYRLFLRKLVNSTSPSYTSTSNAAVDNTIYNYGVIILYYGQHMHNYFTNYQLDNFWNNCGFFGHSTK
jgi:hypothetical protein